MIPTYTEEQIFEAIQKEDLAPCAYGYKTPYCIYIFTDGKEKEEVWENLPTPLHGFEPASWNNNLIDMVDYYLLSTYSENDIKSIEFELKRDKLI